jgi:uncharacterized protein (TIGR02271 family)
VSTGLFGTKVSFVPIDGARLAGDDVVVNYAKDVVKDAPRVDADGQLSIEEEQTLYSYYGRSYDDTLAAAGNTSSGNQAQVAAEPRRKADAEPRRDATRPSVTRSEEELSVNKRTQEAGRVKLKKWVETEDVHVTVPVERQMAKVVREPVRDGDTTGADTFTEGEEEVVLSEEIVDVDKRTVAKERIGLETVTETKNVDVDETVRKERVGVEGDTNLSEGTVARERD